MFQKKKKVEKQNRKTNPKKKKGSNITNILLVIILVLGLGIILYPSVSDWWNDMHSTKAIASYVEQVEKIEDNTKKEMLEEARKYNEALQTGIHFNLSEEEYAKYESILDVSGTGIMGYVQIPAIHVNLPVYHGTDETVLQIAAGHIAGSSFPIGGKGTHAVISGHRGLPSAKLFTDLDKLIIGDVFVVNVLNQEVTYQIDQIHIVLPDEVNDLAIEKDKDYMTLVTCTPYGVNSHRMLVRGYRIDNLAKEHEVLITSEARKISSQLVMLCIAIILIIIAMAGSFVFAPKKKSKRTDRELLEMLEKSFSQGGSHHEKK